MEFSEKNKNEVMTLLGTGLSVMSLCRVAGLSYDELCRLADRFGSLKAELHKWYPKYDFEVRVKETPAEEIKEEIPAKKPVKKGVKKLAVSKGK